MVEEKDGQIALFDKRKSKAPVWHYSMSWIYCTCPSCRGELHGNDEEKECCVYCGQPFDHSVEGYLKSRKASKEFLQANADWWESTKYIDRVY